MGAEKIYDAVLSGDAKGLVREVEAALAAGGSPETILKDSLIRAMGEVGSRFESGDFYVPEMLVAARAMKAGLDVLRPLLAKSGAKPVGKAAIGTVQGDLHDIGKNLVGIMLEGAGFELVDLGTDVPPTRFVEVAKEGVDLIGMSALLTTTMTAMASVIESIEAAGLRKKAKIIVGGAPVTQEYARRIGADGYAADAAEAVKVAKALLGV